ncbi:MAG: BTAD domain-containing putative transcriptional regulator [Micropruina sp.]|uniref:BTAD domain-containing putative transcriptional regulator n=1 Tax=Micropruina sp. TaxID=2737536 RepID=UPI0039E5EA46
MEPVVFLEKVRRPDARGLVRDRLDSVAASVRTGAPGDAASTLVIGPPGSGKTTLLSQFASGAGRVGWYRAGREDGDAASVTRYLGHALAVALDDPALALAAAGGMIDDVIRALDDAGPRRGLLFVDDLQEIAGTPAERALETLLLMRPRELGIVLGSRRPPSIDTARLVVSGELRELDGDDLRFRSWEVEQLFRTVYDAPLSPEGAAALTRRTGGWAAGLHLFHLATARYGRTERERAIGELGGRSRLIRSYLARNVLDGIDPERLEFLLRTATLGVLTGRLCDDLLATCGSASVLAALEDEQFFTTSTDGGVTYRYHHVLQTQLEVLLVDRLGASGARELYRRSAELLERDARIGAAVHAYARAEDWGAVARLLTPVPPATDGDAVTGLLALPGVPDDDPCLAIAGARLLARRGQLGEAVAAYRRAELLLDDRPFIERSRRERRSLELWLPNAAPPPATAAGGLSPVSVELRAVTRWARAAVSTPLAQAVHQLIAGRLDEAASALDRVGADEGWELLAGRLMRQFLCLVGDGEPDAGGVEAVLLEADLEGWPWLARIARGVQLAALIASAPEEWTASAHELIDSYRGGAEPWTEAMVAIALGAGFARAGRPEAAATALAHAGEVADRMAAPALRAWTRLLCSGLVATAVVTPAPPTVTASDRRDEGPRVVLSCLGGFRLSVDGRPVDHVALRPRARSLLMLLALHHRRPLHREHLLEQLWPGSSLASGVHCLQVSVSSIRLCLEAAGLDREALVREGDAYALRIAGADDRLRSFERLVADAAASGDRATALRLRTAALALYNGDLLPEAGPAEWVVDERDRLRRLATTAASAAASDALATGDPRTALEHAHRAIDLDPYQDSSWSLIAESNLRLGNHSAAALAQQKQAWALAELGLTR